MSGRSARALVAAFLVVAANMSTSIVPAATHAGATAAWIPIYLGVPESNVAKRWGQELEGRGTGYLHCNGSPIYSAFHALYNAKTDRVIYIGSRGGCFPSLRVDWRLWARAYLPPDAQFVEEVSDGDYGIADRYTSRWLALRIGSPDITVLGGYSTGVNGSFGPYINVWARWI